MNTIADNNHPILEDYEHDIYLVRKDFVTADKSEIMFTMNIETARSACKRLGKDYKIYKLVQVSNQESQ